MSYPSFFLWPVAITVVGTCVVGGKSINTLGEFFLSKNTKA